MSRFQGKVAIVTGSSSGIGAATAVLFAREGAKVTITGRNTDGLAATKKAILGVGANEDHINVVAVDVTDALGREQIITTTIQKFGQLDILINNAGAAFRDTNGSMGVDAGTDVLEKTMKLNVNSVVELIQLARPHLIKAKGEVVNVSSIAGQPKGLPAFMYYSMAKSALDQLTRSLAVQFIADGIRVNSVSPGAVVTRFAQNVGMSDAEAANLYEQFSNSKQSLPIREVGQPEDIANVIAFLADRRASRYIIGQTIIADGGSVLTIAADAAFSV
ncbi:hypothetical protein RB195_017205 [Necator americanus]|uniref:Oxidoreductase, short chain dehydrogenase/reductase family protein n=1 Tax=Necator americanus TaxID=51031 RepID=A0ABR1C7T6_NECAM